LIDKKQTTHITLTITVNNSYTVISVSVCMPTAKHSLIGSFRNIPLSPISNNYSRRRLFFHRNSMDNNQHQHQTQSERDSHHVHYNHTHPSKYARWNARYHFPPNISFSLFILFYLIQSNQCCFLQRELRIYACKALGTSQ
jgi:hypothetical protein